MHMTTLMCDVDLIEDGLHVQIEGLILLGLKKRFKENQPLEAPLKEAKIVLFEGDNEAHGFPHIQGHYSWFLATITLEFKGWNVA